MAKLSVIFLDKSRLDIYSSDRSAIFSFDLTPFSSNVEINNTSNFEQSIKEFIDSNKIPPSDVVLVLAESILFAKGLPAENQDEDEEAKFADTIPFDNVAFRAYPVQGGKLIVATNKSYYIDILTAFEKNGFSISSVLPVYSTGVNIDSSLGFTVENATSIIRSADSLKQQGFDAAKEKETEKKAENNINTPKPDRKRLFLLLGALGVLIIILVIVGLNSFRPSPQKEIPTPLPTRVPSPTLSSGIGSPSASLSKENIEIKIQFLASSASDAQILQNNLTNAGFKKLENELTNSGSPNSLVLFSTKVPLPIREEITSEVEKVSTNFITQENQNLGSDVLILLVK